MAAGDLTTVDAVKIFIGIPALNTSEDAKLAALITQVSQLICTSIGQPVQAATYTEIYDLENGGNVTVNVRPLNSVTSVWVDYNRVFGSDTLLDTSRYLTTLTRRGVINLLDYAGLRILNRIAGRLSGLQSKYKQVVKVTYNGGYTTVPTDLVLVCNLLVAAFRLVGPYGGAMITSESLKIYSYSLGTIPLGQPKNGSFESMASIPGIIANYRGLGLRVTSAV